MNICVRQPCEYQPETVAFWNFEISEELLVSEEKFGAYGINPEESVCRHAECQNVPVGSCIHAKIAEKVVEKCKTEEVDGFIYFTDSNTKDIPTKVFSTYDEIFDGEQENYFFKIDPSQIPVVAKVFAEHKEKPFEGDYPKKVAKKKLDKIPSLKKKYSWMLPKPEGYAVEDSNWYSLIEGIQEGKNIIAIGPKGCGKTEIMIEAAKAAKKDLHKFNMGATSDPRSTLIGNTHFNKDVGTFTVQSRFAKAIQLQNAAILLDETSRMMPAAFNILLPLMDRQGYLAIDEADDTKLIYRNPTLAILATANVGIQYTGTMRMDSAFMDRFARILMFNYPEPDDEIKIIINRNHGVDKSEVTAIVKMAAAQRSMEAEGTFTDAISTRMLIETGSMLKKGFSVKDALQVTVLNSFSSAGGKESEQAKILQLMQTQGLE